ncbi:hypothetical protein CRUP_029399 [Coryphaenoides rupestris]|nr:hypothetical protein CRUP_029399 [Coryphaenoides rupestris]
MRLVCSSLLLALCLLDSETTGVAPPTGVSSPQPRHGRLERWVRAAVRGVARAGFFSAEGNCRRRVQLQLLTAAVYVSEPVVHLDKVVVVLPDSPEEDHRHRLEEHHHPAGGGAPPPGGAGSTTTTGRRAPPPGEEEQQQHTTDHHRGPGGPTTTTTHRRGLLVDPETRGQLRPPGEECLTLALKGRCQNQLKRPPSTSQRLPGDLAWRVGLCEVTFLPLVFGLRDSNKTQRLRCIEHAEFGPCPRPLDPPSSSQQLSSCELNKGVVGALPAIEKAVIRQYVSYVCRKHHCVDSLVLFLNSPTSSDGSMLLWDHNLNGITTGVAPPTGVSSPQPRHGRLERWVRAAVRYLKLQRCRRAGFFSAEGNCRRRVQLQLLTAAVYVSEPVVHLDKVVVVLPDSPEEDHRHRLEEHHHPAGGGAPPPGGAGAPPPPGGGAPPPGGGGAAAAAPPPPPGTRGPHHHHHHDAVLLVDPRPGDNFGHPVVLFYVDANVTKTRCSLMDGLYLEHAEFGAMSTAAGPPLPPASNCRARELWGLYQRIEKAVIRQYVSYVCRKHHCVDSLVLFLNSPTSSDGSMLLWDHNLNGIAESKERYSVNELLVDLAGCRASRVLVFVDQSYSSVLSKRLQTSSKHLNVVPIISSSRRDRRQLRDREPAGGDVSWSRLTPRTCLIDQLAKGPGKSCVLGPPWAGLLNVTLAGAPCKATPPLTDGELRREYLGCQNLPTALWCMVTNESNFGTQMSLLSRVDELDLEMSCCGGEDKEVSGITDN